MRRWGRSIAVLVCLVMAAPGALAGNVQSAERDQRAGAQKTFEAGGKLYDTKHYEEALAAFRASYQIVASPNSRLMVARCLRELRRNAEAYAEYDSVAAEATKDGERYKTTGETAVEERDELKAKIALLTILVANAPPGVTVKVGAAVVDPTSIGTPLPFEPGQVTVTADGTDGASAHADVTLTAGASSDVELRLATAPAPAAPPPPLPTPPPPATPPPPVVDSSPTPLRTWAYVAGGVGGAGLITFAIFGAMTASKYSSLQSSCPAKQCPPGKQGDIDDGQTFQTVANVGLGVGIAGIAAGTTLFFLSQGKPKDSASSVHLSVGIGSAEVSGRF